MRSLIFAFLILSFSCVAQSTKGTVKVKKTVKDTAGSMPRLVSPEAVYMRADIMPEFPGGNAKLMAFINTNIVYPRTAIDSALSGTSYTTFIVNTDGTLSDIKTLKGVPGCPQCDAEAIRVVKKMPPWKPGMQNGLNVRIQFTLPIRFRLT